MIDEKEIMWLYELVLEVQNRYLSLLTVGELVIPRTLSDVQLIAKLDESRILLKKRLNDTLEKGE